jgi:hypothetical protein
MKYEVMKEWVEALRSGKYVQSKQALRSSGCDNGFCCLGVLCEISGLHGWEATKNSADMHVWLYNGTADYLPTDVKDWAGLQSENPKIYNDEVSHHVYILSNLNDLEGYDFDAIADLIEENWSTL